MKGWLLTICLLASSMATAQTGPLQARVVLASIPGHAIPKHDSKMELSVTVELAVGTDGKVADVRIVESSGEASFDQKVQRFYQNWRLVPQLDEHGTAIATTMKLRFKRAGIGSLPPSAPPLRSDDTRVYDEVERIGRMTCKDFLWEYDLMKQIAGRQRSINQEQLLKTSLAMFVVQEKVNGTELKELGRAFDTTVRESVESCRLTPEEKYWHGVLAPELKAKLQR